MKKFFQFVLMILIIAIFSCKGYKDEFVINEHDGANGKDGLSIVTKVDPIYEGSTLLGYTTNYYQDTDNSGNYTTGDKFQNSFSLFNGSNGTNGLSASIKTTLMPASTEAPMGSILIESFTGTDKTGSLSFALPSNGINGQNGYSPVMNVKEIKDQNGSILGNQTSFYLDMDRDGVTSMADTFMGGFITWNGINGTNGSNGTNGTNGQTPNVTFEIINGDLIITSAVNGLVVSTVRFTLPKNGQNGQNGYSPVMTTEVYKDESGAVVGNIIKFWLDLDRSGSYSVGDSYMNSIIVLNGINGQDGIAKICTINFDIVNSSDCPSGQSINFTSSIDGKIVDSASFCIPKDGQDGHDAHDGHDHVCVKKTKESDYEKDEWYWDTNHDNKYDDGDTKLGECHI